MSRSSRKANEIMAPLHDRMPVILERDEYGPWLDPDCAPEALLQLPDGFPSERMETVPVSSYVSNARHEGPECIAPVAG